MIQTEDLTKHFDDFIAVDGVNLDISPGQVLVLLGPNGAGKTTTVRMLTSILVPTRGRAAINGFDVVQDAEQVRALVGVLTEHHGLYGRMNAEEYLSFFGSLYGLKGPEARTRIGTLLEQFGLAEARYKRLGEYSKGMRQKLALTRAILHDPPVLLLDEPTSAMDPESARMVRDAIHTLRSSDRTIILCTHNLVEAEELADRIAIIHHGKIFYNDTADNLKATLLGPVEFEALLAESVDSWHFKPPAGVKLTSQGLGWLRFQIDDPRESNPKILRQMLDDNLKILSFREIPRSLEQVYLKAVKIVSGKEQNV